MGVETSVGFETKRRVTNQAGFTAPGKAQMPAGLDCDEQ